MRRLLVVVLVLLAIAFLANKYILGNGDPPPPGFDQPSAAPADAGAPAPPERGPR